MPVAIVGMHRSGTSMVAQLLHRSGLYLGEEDALLGPSADNPDGYWEHTGFHRLNEAVLSELGGGWDEPPDVPLRWQDDPQLLSTAREARRLIKGFDGREPWGWKDPRTSVTLGLWMDLIPDLKVVVCVRNPLEVAFSLNRRGMFSYSHALRLWQTYHERILQVCDPQRWVMADYSAFFTRPEAELERVLSHVGIAAPPETVRDAAAVCRADLRHVHFDVADLERTRVARPIIDLYRSMTDVPPDEHRRVTSASTPEDQFTSSRVVDENLLELEATTQQLRRLMSDLDHLQGLLRARNEDLANLRTRESELVRETEVLRERIRSQDELLGKISEVQASFFALETEMLAAFAHGRDSYADQIHRIKALVQQSTPPGACVAVVSKGDERLLGLYGRTGVHIPQDDDGAATGHHPASGLSIIAHLEVVRARGAEYFLLPAMYFWWLEYYPELRRHLNSRFRRLRWDAEAGVLFALQGPLDTPAQFRAVAADLAGAIQSKLKRGPSVLDWNTGLDLVNAVPQAQVFAQAPERGALPFPDQSVDIVAVATADPAVEREALRVGSAATICFPVNADECDAPTVHFKQSASAIEIRDVSIIIPVGAESGGSDGVLISLEQTLPQTFQGEIVIVCAGSRSARFDAFARNHQRTTVISSAARLDTASAVNEGVDACTEERVILLGAETLLLPDWLRPLVDLLDEQPQAGAAGGVVLAPDGSLLEAGGTLFSDGSAWHVGWGHPDPAEPDFSYVRKVDFCSELLLATRRQTFQEVGGLRVGLPVEHLALDYCVSLRGLGKEVYFQPLSAVVDFSGQLLTRAGCNGLQPPMSGADAKPSAAWRAALKQQPQRPEMVDGDTLKLHASRS